MGFHHVAITTRDADATHAFYTEVMGFDLVRVEAAPAAEGGWARHLFYDTGQRRVPRRVGPARQPVGARRVRPVDQPRPRASRRGRTISRSPSRTSRRWPATGDRWRDHGYDVLQIDHGWCTSIYLDDPNGIAVECCCTTRAFTDADARGRQRRRAARPALTRRPTPEVYEATTLAAALTSEPGRGVGGGAAQRPCTRAAISATRATSSACTDCR